MASFKPKRLKSHNRKGGHMNNEQQVIELNRALQPQMGIGIQVNMTLKLLEVIVFMNGHPVPNGGVSLNRDQAREHIGKLMQAFQVLEQGSQAQSKLILPPGVARPL